MLVSWVGLEDEEVSWEDLSYISGLVTTMDFEAKVHFAGGVDITIALDLQEVKCILIEELGLVDDEEAPAT